MPQQMIDRDRAAWDRRGLATRRPAPAGRASAFPCARECLSAPTSPIWSRRSRGSASRRHNRPHNARRRRGHPSPPQSPWCGGMAAARAPRRRGRARRRVAGSAARRRKIRRSPAGAVATVWLPSRATGYPRPRRRDRDGSQDLRDRRRGCGRSRATSPRHRGASDQPGNRSPRRSGRRRPSLPSFRKIPSRDRHPIRTSPNRARWRRSRSRPSAHRGPALPSGSGRVRAVVAARMRMRRRFVILAPAWRMNACRPSARTGGLWLAGFGNWAGRNWTRLADFGKRERLQRTADQTRASFRRRYSVGVTPVVALKARLKGPSD